jgi:predicted HicB family RNase H-like nuclease
MMEYKRYFAKVEFDDDADIFHGEVINIYLASGVGYRGPVPDDTAVMKITAYYAIFRIS